MKKLNHYQKDIAFILLLIVLQLAFTHFFPFRNPEVLSPIEVTKSFLIIRFTFIDSGQITTYFPSLTFIYAALIALLIIQKNRRYALIYGFAVVLVTKAYYLTELYVLEGVYANLQIEGIISKKVIANGEILAQDVSLYVLGILLLIKIGIYVHDIYMFKKNPNTTPYDR